MRFAKCAAVIAALTVSWSAMAQDSAHPGGGALRAACAADLQQFCANVQPGGGRIMGCLRDNEDKLSQSCKDAQAAMRARKEHKSVPQ